MRFTIRDLMWLMVVVGLSVGWWLNRRQILTEHDIFERATNIYRDKANRLNAHLHAVYDELWRKQQGLEVMPGSLLGEMREPLGSAVIPPEDMIELEIKRIRSRKAD
jgi:hypothetical protein